MEMIIEKLKECFLPHNIECDGGCCTGCWKDVVREVIKMLEQSRQAAVSGSLPPIKDAVDFAKWVRDNTIADGAPKLFLRQYEKVNKDKSRYTMEELYDVYRSGNDR